MEISATSNQPVKYGLIALKIMTHLLYRMMGLLTLTTEFKIMIACTVLTHDWTDMYYDIFLPVRYISHNYYYSYYVKPYKNTIELRTSLIIFNAT